MGISQSYGPAKGEELLHVLDLDIELSFNFWDTADMYGAGKSELLQARASKNHSSKVFQATKVGNVNDRNLTSHRDQLAQNAIWIIAGAPDYDNVCWREDPDDENRYWDDQAGY